MQHPIVALVCGKKRNGWVAHVRIADLIPKCLRLIPWFPLTILFLWSLNFWGDPPE
jgi:hypothetical protein